MWRSLHFFKHACNIERETIAIDVTVIRDRIVSAWSTVVYSVPCLFEDGGNTIIENEFAGKIPLHRFNVYFEGDVDIRPNDRLKKGSTYYLVETVYNHGGDGKDFDIQAIVREMPLGMEH